LDRVSFQLNVGDFLIRVTKSRRMRRVGCVAGMGDKKNMYMVLLRKPEGNRPHGRPRHRKLDI
jgi:hypothetical protein